MTPRLRPRAEPTDDRHPGRGVTLIPGAPRADRHAGSRRVWLAVALLLAACGGGGAPPPAGTADGPDDGGWAVVPLTADPRSFNWVLSNDSVMTRVARLIGDSLVDHGPDLSYVPRLAEGWEIDEDGRRITFRLREGVRWHDGQPLTADDVLFTYRVAVDPSIGAGVFASYFSEVESIEAPDDLTVVVTYRSAFSPALQGWETLLILPHHRFPDGEDVRGQPFEREPIGTGPYRLREWFRGQQIVLEANPEYWAGRPHLGRILFRIVPDLRTAYGALLAGELDLARVPPGEGGAGDRVRLVRSASLKVSFIAWQGDGSNPFFADARVRRAMTHALDRDGFVDTVLDGQGRVATSTFVPGTWAYDEGIEPLTDDPAQAASLLDEAGWVRAEGSPVRERDGIPFRFSVNVYRRNVEMERLALLLQDSLRRLGVEMQIVRLDWPEFLERLHGRRFEAQIHVWTLDVEPDPYDFWHSSQIASGMNYAGYADADVDRWSEEGRRTFDRAERAELYRKVQRRLQRDQPFTFVHYPEYLLGVAPRLKGLRTTPAGPWQWYPAVLDWWVPAAQQRHAPAPAARP